MATGDGNNSDDQRNARKRKLQNKFQYILKTMLLESPDDSASKDHVVCYDSNGLPVSKDELRQRVQVTFRRFMDSKKNRNEQHVDNNGSTKITEKNQPTVQNRENNTANTEHSRSRVQEKESSAEKAVTNGSANQTCEASINNQMNHEIAAGNTLNKQPGVGENESIVENAVTNEPANHTCENTVSNQVADQTSGITTQDISQQPGIGVNESIVENAATNEPANQTFENTASTQVADQNICITTEDISQQPGVGEKESIVENAVTNEPANQTCENTVSNQVADPIGNITQGTSKQPDVREKESTVENSVTNEPSNQSCRKRTAHGTREQPSYSENEDEVRAVTNMVRAALRNCENPVDNRITNQVNEIPAGYSTITVKEVLDWPMPIMQEPEEVDPFLNYHPDHQTSENTSAATVNNQPDVESNQSTADITMNSMNNRLADLCEETCAEQNMQRNDVEPEVNVTVGSVSNEIMDADGDPGASNVPVDADATEISTDVGEIIEPIIHIRTDIFSSDSEDDETALQSSSTIRIRTDIFASDLEEEDNSNTNSGTGTVQNILDTSINLSHSIPVTSYSLNLGGLGSPGTNSITFYATTPDNDSTTVTATRIEASSSGLHSDRTVQETRAVRQDTPISSSNLNRQDTPSASEVLQRVSSSPAVTDGAAAAFSDLIVINPQTTATAYNSQQFGSILPSSASQPTTTSTANVVTGSSTPPVGNSATFYGAMSGNVATTSVFTTTSGNSTNISVSTTTTENTSICSTETMQICNSGSIRIPQQSTSTAVCAENTSTTLGTRTNRENSAAIETRPNLVTALNDQALLVNQESQEDTGNVTTRDSYATNSPVTGLSNLSPSGSNQIRNDVPPAVPMQMNNQDASSTTASAETTPNDQSSTISINTSSDSTHEKSMEHEFPSISRAYGKVCRDFENLKAIVERGDNTVPGTGVQERINGLEALKNWAINMFDQVDRSLIRMKTTHTRVQIGSTPLLTDTEMSIEQMCDYFEVLISILVFHKGCKEESTRSVSQTLIVKVQRILYYYMYHKNPAQSERKFLNVTNMMPTRPALSAHGNPPVVLIHLWDKIRIHGHQFGHLGAILDHNLIGVEGFRERINRMKACQAAQQQRASTQSSSCSVAANNPTSSSASGGSYSNMVSNSTGVQMTANSQQQFDQQQNRIVASTVVSPAANNLQNQNQQQCQRQHIHQEVSLTQNNCSNTNPGTDDDIVFLGESPSPVAATSATGSAAQAPVQDHVPSVLIHYGGVQIGATPYLGNSSASTRTSTVTSERMTTSGNAATAPSVESTRHMHGNRVLEQLLANTHAANRTSYATGSHTGNSANSSHVQPQAPPLSLNTSSPSHPPAATQGFLYTRAALEQRGNQSLSGQSQVSSANMQQQPSASRTTNVSMQRSGTAGTNYLPFGTRVYQGPVGGFLAMPTRPLHHINRQGRPSNSKITQSQLGSRVLNSTVPSVANSQVMCNQPGQLAANAQAQAQMSTNQQYQAMTNQQYQSAANQQYLTTSQQYQTNERNQMASNQQYQQQQYPQSQIGVNPQVHMMTNRQRQVIVNRPSQMAVNPQGHMLTNRQGQSVPSDQGQMMANQQRQSMGTQQGQVTGHIQGQRMVNQQGQGMAHHQGQVLASQRSQMITNQLVQGIAHQQTQMMTDQQSQLMANQQIQRVAHPQGQVMASHQHGQLMTNTQGQGTVNQQGQHFSGGQSTNTQQPNPSQFY